LIIGIVFRFTAFFLSPLLPEQSEQYEQPEQSEQSEQPEQAEQSEQSEQYEQYEQPEQSEQSEQPEQSEQYEQPEQSEQPEQPEQSEQSEQPEQSEQAEQSEQSEQYEQYEQPEQSEQYEQAEQPEQAEQSEQSEQFFKLSSATCAFSSLPQYSTEHLLPLESFIQVTVSPPISSQLLFRLWPGSGGRTGGRCLSGRSGCGPSNSPSCGTRREWYRKSWQTMWCFLA
jgi:type IV secretory pathway VirB10-like protein